MVIFMKDREWFEDSIQSVLCKCLPNMPPSNIRPAYIKALSTNPFAVNHMDATDPMKDGVKAARNTTDIIYFWWHFDPLDYLSTEVSDTVSAVVLFRLTVTCYGEHSMSNAIRLRAFFRTEGVLSDMLNMQAVLSRDPTLTTFPEEFNGQWWERTDVDFSIQALIDDLAEADETLLNELGYGSGYSTATGGKVDVMEVSDELK